MRSYEYFSVSVNGFRDAVFGTACGYRYRQAMVQFASTVIAATTSTNLSDSNGLEGLTQLGYWNNPIYLAVTNRSEFQVLQSCLD